MYSLHSVVHYTLHNILLCFVRGLLSVSLRSSSYGICMGTATTILGFYMYHLTEILPLWNIIGMVLFTLNEYMSHRFILHHYNDGELYHYLHGNHHMRPFGSGIHIPILFTTTMSVGFFYIGWIYFSFIKAVNMMLAYQLSYILFEHIHKEIHHPSWFKNERDPFRLFHMYHHMKNKNRAYSFSVPLWDLVFGTFPHDTLTYNWFAFVPIPFFSFRYGTKER